MNPFRQSAHDQYVPGLLERLASWWSEWQVPFAAKWLVYTHVAVAWAAACVRMAHAEADRWPLDRTFAMAACLALAAYLFALFGRGVGWWKS